MANVLEELDWDQKISSQEKSDLCVSDLCEFDHVIPTENKPIDNTTYDSKVKKEIVSEHAMQAW